MGSIKRIDFLKVRGIMIENVVTVAKEKSIKEVISILHNKHIGSVLITDKDRKCEGIFTERDAIRVIATGISLSTSLKEVMSKNPITIRENATFAEAKRLMNTHQIRHLPVVDDNGTVVGLLCLRQVLDELFNIHTVTS
jgi:CBS domain-containing protein